MVQLVAMIMIVVSVDAMLQNVNALLSKNVNDHESADHSMDQVSMMRIIVVIVQVYLEGMQICVLHEIFPTMHTHELPIRGTGTVGHE